MALIPPFVVDSVVALGRSDASGNPRWTASGFLFGSFQGRLDATSKQYRVYLVTNRHVLQDGGILLMRFNPEGSDPARSYSGDLVKPDGSPSWSGHPDPQIDVAVLPLDLNELRARNIRANFFRSDQHAGTREWLTANGASEGDGVFALGFPMGLVGRSRNVVVVRQGAIARIRDCLDGTENDFLVDATVFPGNSGGPVVLRPETASIVGTPHPQEARLVGIVTGYVPHNDVAVSGQTGQTRVVFQENSGLAAVHPVDYILDAIAEHVATLPGPHAAEAAASTQDASDLLPEERSGTRP